ncbi:hypothetical protein KH5_11390 [Urechidicola sp. KH5]
MKLKQLFIAILLLFPLGVSSQILDPISWTTATEITGESEVTLIATATIDEGWHLYAQQIPEDGPIPTSFVFKSSSEYLKKGNTKEETGIELDDPVFKMRLKYFENQATFKQRIKRKLKTAFKVNAIVEFMVCNETQCLPPKEMDLIFEIN